MFRYLEKLEDFKGYIHVKQLFPEFRGQEREVKFEGILLPLKFGNALNRIAYWKCCFSVDDFIETPHLINSCATFVISHLGSFWKV